MNQTDLAADDMDHLAAAAAERDLAHKVVLALIHRLALAAGGELTIKLSEIPAEIPLHVRVANGLAHVRAMPRQSQILRVPAGRPS